METIDGKKLEKIKIAIGDTWQSKDLSEKELGRLVSKYLPAINAADKGLLVSELHRRLEIQKYRKEKGLEGTKSKENEFLVSVLGASILPVEKTRFTDLIRGNLDWDYLRFKSAQHLVAPLLFHTLMPFRHVSDGLAHFLDFLEIETDRARQSDQSFACQLNLILEKAADQNIEICLLKGAALKHTAYGEPHLRPAGDLDILIHRKDLTCFSGLMKEAGFVSAREVHEVHASNIHRLFVPCSGTFSRDEKQHRTFPVEAHWHIIGNEAAFRLPVEALWKRSLPAPGSTWPARMPAPEDMMMHLSLHCVFSHGFKLELLHYYDFLTLSYHSQNSIDWERLASISTEYGVGHFVYAAMKVTSEIFNYCPMPSPVLDQLHKELNFSQRRRLNTLDRTQILEHYISTKDVRDVRIKRLLWIKGVRNKCLFLLSTFFPPRENLAGKYGLEEKSFRVYFYYLHHIISLLLEHTRGFASGKRNNPPR